MPKIRFHPGNREIEVAEGESLLRAAMLAGVHVNASCGGSGVCGKCRVVVEGGAVEAGPAPKLTAGERERGYVLACTSTARGEAEIRVPVESQLGTGRAVLDREQRSVSHGKVLARLDLAEHHARYALAPATRRLFLELPPPSLEDSIGDLERLRRELARAHGAGEFSVDLPVLAGMARTLREGQWRVTATLREGGEGEPARLLRLDPGDRSGRHVGLAIDIGTTTVYVDLVDLATRASLARASEYNAQVSCGEDIISRIVYSLKKDGLARLQELVAGTINGLIDRVLGEAGIEREDVVDAVAAGNTTMVHLFLGIDPRHIREEPYIPTVGFVPTVPAAELGLRIAAGARVACVPCRASYVGGDITAGLLASGVAEGDRVTLYIDVGTNGEMALGNREWLLSCACSAGPAFEGGSVKHGMRAVAGAIETVRINPATLEPMILTVGQKRPLGICGSGLIDAVAELFLTGVVNAKGKFDRSLEHPRIRAGEGGHEYVLVFAAESATGGDIVVTEADLDNLIRTKGAIYAGIATLLEQMQMPMAAVEQVYIAGGFGRYLELDQAVTIGLLPEIGEDRVQYVGNGSLLGARLALLSREARERAGAIARQLTYLELSTTAGFMDNYVAALFLPHTDRSAFPSVLARVRQGAPAGSA